MCSNHIGATIEKVLRNQGFFFFSKSTGQLHMPEQDSDISLNTAQDISEKQGCRQSVIFAPDTVSETCMQGIADKVFLEHDEGQSLDMPGRIK